MSDQHSFLITPVDQFRDAIARKGMVPPDAIIDDGKIHHFSSTGRPGDDKGWYVFHDGDIPTGAFGDFRQYGTASFPWVADIGRDWTPVEKSDYQKKQADMRAKRKAETEQKHAEAKDKAATILQLSSPARDGHPYLQRKGVGAYHLVVDEKRTVVVTKDEITFARKPKHRLDQSYAASCEHARQFWGGQMEVHGDSQHLVKAWAYASVYGVQVTNFTPNTAELLEAEKIIAGLRITTEPSVRRPGSAQPANRPGSKPNL